MKTDLDHLPANKQRELERVKAIVFEEFEDAIALGTMGWKKKGRIDKIILYGSYPIAFEHFAADVARMIDPNIVSLDVTRPSRDGGRDGIGRYRIGQPQNCITVDFAIEAKCHSASNGLGVKVLARLISRLRHRQFGMLITTSFLADQAYEELVEDQHPIVVCAGGDIAELLIERAGLSSRGNAVAWLSETYPHEHG